MKTKTLVAVAVLAAALAGCDAAGTASTPDSAPTTPPTPEELLIKAVPAADSVRYKFSVKGGDVPLAGVLDAAKHSYRYDLTEVNADPHFKMTMNFLFIGGKTWVKINFSDHAGVTGLPSLPAKWMLIDPAKLSDAQSLPKEGDDTTDPGATGAVVGGLVSAKETSPGHFVGTTDLTKQPDAGIVDAATLKALGAKAKSAIFQAATDGSGRLTSLVVHIPTAGKTKAHTYAVSYADYGKVTTPAVPSATEQVKAPSAAYDMLNG